MSMRLTTAFVLFTGIALSGCAQTEKLGREGVLGVKSPAPTEKCIHVMRGVPLGCRPIQHPH